jgi:hypothetical protein
MAFIAPLAGAAVGGGLLGSIVTTAVGVGINLAIAYFFPQKIKGPRAESLKAQTSQYGDQIARTYGSIRTAGAVIWLKGDHVDEHVKTERQGKALGPEVTTYSYTATFAVAFAWNGPCSGVPRIWADDKLIYDVSSEALQHAIDNGGKGIGVAMGASVTVYLGTDDQKPVPDIEADRGAGQVPAWPGIVYVVIKNLPLDEFGIRVPNIEAEIAKGGSSSYLSVDLGLVGFGNSFINWDSNGLYAAWANLDTSFHPKFYIWSLPAGTLREVPIATQGGGSHIDDRNNVIVADRTTIQVYDAATGALTDTIARSIVGTNNFGTAMDDISFGGTTYLLMLTNGGFTRNFTMLTNAGFGYIKQWEAATSSFTSVNSAHGVSVGPDYGYFVGQDDATIIRVDIDIVGLNETVVAPAGLTDDIAICHYDEESDSVVIVCANGDIFVYTPDLSTLLRSKTGNGFTVPLSQGATSKRMKVGSDQIGIVDSDQIVRIYKLSDLEVLNVIDPAVVGWPTEPLNRGEYSFNADISMVFAPYHALNCFFWFLPRAGRVPVPVADVIEEECTLAGLPCYASQITDQLFNTEAG